MGLSHSQLTRLGERLKSARLEEADLRLLDEYRRTFATACDVVVQALHAELKQPLTVRGAKSTQAIVEKLRRQSCRLGQIQDIAGCRLVVDTLPEQDDVLGKIRALYPDAVQHDRREAPSHGYRAVHVVVKEQGRWVEIQVRTELQHLWANLSEMLADLCGNAVKYGGGPTEVLRVLSMTSDLIERIERREQKHALRRQALRPMPSLPERLLESGGVLNDDERGLLADYRELERFHLELAQQLAADDAEREQLRRELRVQLDAAISEIRKVGRP